MSSDYLESLFGLTGKVAVITGGGGVLCRAMGLVLARVGPPPIGVGHPPVEGAAPQSTGVGPPPIGVGQPPVDGAAPQSTGVEPPPIGVGQPLISVGVAMGVATGRSPGLPVTVIFLLSIQYKFPEFAGSRMSRKLPSGLRPTASTTYPATSIPIFL